MSAGPLFELEALTVRRGGRPLVEDLGFTLQSGDCIAMLGPSGSGKTTACLAAFGLTSDSCEIDGSYRLRETRAPAGTLPNRAPPEIAFILQAPGDNFSPYARISGQLNDCYRFSLFHRPSEIARELAFDLGLPDFGALIQRSPNRLSRGEIQRLALVAALVAGPRLLVADEPTAALDERSRQRWCEVVNRWRARTGMAIWLVTHDMRVVDALGARTIELASSLRETEPAPVPAQVVPRPVRPTTVPLLTLAGRQLRPGGCLILTGVSGSGKSSLLHSIAAAVVGSSPPHPTGVSLVGPDWVRLPPGPAGLAMVFQDARTGLNPHRAIVDSLQAVLMRRGVAKRCESEAWIQTEFAALDLPAALAARRPEALSAGEVQRVALLLALASAPRLLLCDEPTSALGASHRRRVVDRLRQAQASGTALLIATHESTLAAALGAATFSLRDPDGCAA